MKSTILLSAFSLVSVVTAIWPIPAAYEHGDKLLWISKDVGFYYAEKDQAVSINRGNNFQKILQRRYFELVEWWRAAANASSAQQEDQGMTCHDIVAYAVEQTWTNIFAKNFVPWKFHKRSWKEPDKEKEYYDTELRRVRLELLQENQQDPAKLEVDESYSIHLPEKGEAKITANTSVGIARGLNTFSQLFVAHSQGGAYTTLAPVTIFDAPVFQHRGLNLDVARQWFSVADIKRTIDAAAFNKMNRFHLHITDSQSWPLKIPSLPKLAAKGAHRPDMVYTVADFREIQRHAAIQGVQLITEIDMPGHTSAIWYSQPELIAAFDVQPDWRTYAAEPPSGTLKLNSSAVDRFLEAVLGDLLPRVRPWSGYFHTGGDEVNLNAYELDETVKSKDPQVLQPLMQRFIDRNHDRVRRAGLTPIVWEEMLLTWNLTLGEDVVVQSWRGDDAVKQIVEKGHKALVGNYKFWVCTIFVLIQQLVPTELTNTPRR
jgi:hexosaminidase